MGRSKLPKGMPPLPGAAKLPAPPKLPSPPKPPRPSGRAPRFFPEIEPDTGKTNQSLALYQRLIAYYHQLSDLERTDLVEFVALFTGATGEDRKRVLRVLRAMLD